MIEFGEECNVRRHWCLRILRQFFDAVSQTVEHQPEPHRPSLFLIKSLPDSCLIIPKAILGGGERILTNAQKVNVRLAYVARLADLVARRLRRYAVERLRMRQVMVSSP